MQHTQQNKPGAILFIPLFTSLDHRTQSPLFVFFYYHLHSPLFFVSHSAGWSALLTLAKSDKISLHSLPILDMRILQPSLNPSDPYQGHDGVHAMQIIPHPESVCVFFPFPIFFCFLFLLPLPHLSLLSPVSCLLLFSPSFSSLSLAQNTNRKRWWLGSKTVWYVSGTTVQSNSRNNRHSTKLGAYQKRTCVHLLILFVFSFGLFLIWETISSRSYSCLRLLHPHICFFSSVPSLPLSPSSSSLLLFSFLSFSLQKENQGIDTLTLQRERVTVGAADGTVHTFTLRRAYVSVCCYFYGVWRTICGVCGCEWETCVMSQADCFFFEFILFVLRAVKAAAATAIIITITVEMWLSESWLSWCLFRTSLRLLLLSVCYNTSTHALPTLHQRDRSGKRGREREEEREEGPQQTKC